MHRFTIAFIIFSFFKLSSCNLCDICTCSESDGIAAFDCNGKLQPNTSGMNLLLYMESDLPGKFILSRNNLTESSLEPLKTLSHLRVIDLSHNFLTGSSLEIFHYWTELNDLDLSFNEWPSFDIGSLIGMSSLLKINLSHNLITNLTPAALSNESHLTHLDLSHNKLTSITETSLNIFPYLQYIDLSFNSINTIDTQSFVNLLSLQTVMLQHNFLRTLVINLPVTLHKLVLSHNEILEFPCNLSVNHLSIDSNLISTISLENINMFKQLEFFNISENHLSTFVDAELPNLSTLDISYNNFPTIPVTLTTKNLPKLDTLVLSGNPISQWKFNAPIKLRRLIIRDSNLLKRIDEDAFNYLKEYDNTCINMTISFNRNLEVFDEKAVEDMNICYMDLENNALKHISKNMRGLQDDSFFKYGLNLQGNPLVCDCASQWMLDELIPRLYKLDPELLTNLRCNEPAKLFNVRMIHWYKWKNRIFCDDFQSTPNYTSLNDSKIVDIEPVSSAIVIESSKSMLLVITSCAVLLAVLVIAGLTFSLKLAHKKRRMNRRF